MAQCREHIGDDFQGVSGCRMPPLFFRGKMFDKATPLDYRGYMMRLPAIAEKAINEFPKHRKYPLQVFDSRHVWALKASWPGDLSATGGWLPLEFYQGNCPRWIDNNKIADKEKQSLKAVLQRLLRRMDLKSFTGTLELLVVTDGTGYVLNQLVFKRNGLLHQIIDGIPYHVPTGNEKAALALLTAPCMASGTLLTVNN